MRAGWAVVVIGAIGALGPWAGTACGPKSGGGRDAAIYRPDGAVPGDGSSPGSDGSNPGTDGSSPGADGAVTPGDGAVHGPDGAVSVRSYCLPACVTAADCDLGSAPGSDPRHLKLHHVNPHVKGGANVVENLVVLCTVCHDVVHRRR